METWDRLLTTCKPHIVVSDLSTRRMCSRSTGELPKCPSIHNASKLPIVLSCCQVCDQPHPLHVKKMIRDVLDGRFDDACAGLKQLYDLGYSPTDIITTLFRVIKNYDMEEYLKLEFMKVVYLWLSGLTLVNFSVRGYWILNGIMQEAGFAHMRICDGVGSLLQLSGLLAKLALVRETAKPIGSFWGTALHYINSISTSFYWVEGIFGITWQKILFDDLIGWGEGTCPLYLIKSMKQLIKCSFIGYSLSHPWHPRLYVSCYTLSLVLPPPTFYTRDCGSLSLFLSTP